MGLTIRTVDLVRSWLGQALRATGAAVVVPVAILLALSLTAIGGSGLGDFGGLSQVVSGPRVAGSDLTVDDGDAEITDAVTQLAAVAADDGGLPGGPTDPGSGIDTGGGGDTPGGGDAPGPGGGDDPGSGGDPSPPGGGDGGGGGGGGGGGPAPPEPPDPGLVEGVGQTVIGLTGGTPVSPTVEDAVDGLVELCGRLGCP